MWRIGMTIYTGTAPFFRSALTVNICDARVRNPSRSGHSMINFLYGYVTFLTSEK